MPVFNYAKKEVNIKIVYYGPGLSGKTTNLQAIHDGTRPEYKGKLVSLATQTDRTLFFDFMPMELGSLGGFRIRLHLYTVPGQVHYNATRKLVLKGVDGVVFVADSQRAMKDANIESFMNLEKNLQSYGKVLKDIPHVIQANKRDIDDIIPMEKIDAMLNRHGVTLTEAVASEGEGVLETLTEIVRIVMKNLKDSFALHRGEGRTREEESGVFKTAGTKQVEVDRQPAHVPGPTGEMESEAEQEPEPEPAQDLKPELAAPGLAVEPSDEGSQPVADEKPPEEEPEEAVYRGEKAASTEAADLETASGERPVHAAGPISVTVPVDGLGMVELTISIKARVLPGSGEKIPEVTFKDRDFYGGKGEPVSAFEKKSEEQDVNSGVSSLDQLSHAIPSNDVRRTAERDLPPLKELHGEPLDEPLDGQIDNIGMKGISDNGGVGGGDDNKPADGGDAMEESSQMYNPQTDHVDLFKEKQPQPPEPEPKKKGVLGFFKKK